MLCGSSYIHYTTWSMDESRKFRTGRHCVFMMHCHLVFVTKYRKVVISDQILKRMKEIFIDICGKFEAELNEVNSDGDHVHLLISYPPKVTLSKLVNSLKGVSSRRIREEFPIFSENHYYKGVLWSPSYFAASCGGAPLNIIKEYIENQ